MSFWLKAHSFQCGARLSPPPIGITYRRAALSTAYVSGTVQKEELAFLNASPFPFMTCSPSDPTLSVLKPPHAAS